MGAKQLLGFAPVIKGSKVSDLWLKAEIKFSSNPPNLNSMCKFRVEVALFIHFLVGFRV